MTLSRVVLHAFSDEARPARSLADTLGIEFAVVDLHRFPDGELLPTVPQTGTTTIVYRSLAQPNDKLIALLLAFDAWRRGGAARLVLVAPYLCYLRQDTVFSPGQPNSQAVIGDLLGARFDRIVTVDPHLHRVHAISDVFPQTEATVLSAAPALAEWLRRSRPDVDLIVGPDSESTQWVAQVAADLGVGWSVMTKQRRGDTDVELLVDQSAQFAGRSIALVDDVCSSGGTLVKAAELLKRSGAQDIVACVTHALFDSSVESRLHGAGISQIASTDSVIHPTNSIPLAPLLANSLLAELKEPFGGSEDLPDRFPVDR